MAISFLPFNDQIGHGRAIRRCLNQLHDGRQGLIDLIATLQRQIDGDSSDASQFTFMTSDCGFPDNATAKAAWDELNSLMFKLTTDSSQSSMNAAILQALSKFG